MTGVPASNLRAANIESAFSLAIHHCTRLPDLHLGFVTGDDGSHAAYTSPQVSR